MNKFCDKCRCVRTYIETYNCGKHYGPGCWMCEKCLEDLIGEKE